MTIGKQGMTTLIVTSIMTGCAIEPETGDIASAETGDPEELDALVGEGPLVTPQAASGPYYIWFAHSPVRRCMTALNYQLQQSDCSADVWLDQLWDFEWMTSDGWARLRNYATNLCANVEWGSTANGTRIVQYPCGSFANELWKGTLYKTVPGTPGRDYYMLKPKHAVDAGLNKCLVVHNASTADGAGLILWDCSHGDLENDVATWAPF